MFKFFWRNGIFDKRNRVHKDLQSKVPCLRAFINGKSSLEDKFLLSVISNRKYWEEEEKTLWASLFTISMYYLCIILQINVRVRSNTDWEYSMKAPKGHPAVIFTQVFNISSSFLIYLPIYECIFQYMNISSNCHLNIFYKSGISSNFTQLFSSNFSHRQVFLLSLIGIIRWNHT